jgi:hypothetical protein
MDNVDAAFEKACAAFDGANFDRLSERDQVLVTIWGLEADVNNGGFDQFFFNGSGDLAFFAPTALKKIGADQMAEIAARANALFGPAGPSRSQDERQQQLAELTADNEDLFDALDEAFYEYPDDIRELVNAFLANAVD